MRHQPDRWRLTGTQHQVGRDERPTERGPYVKRDFDEFLAAVRAARRQGDVDPAHAARFFRDDDLEPDALRSLDTPARLRFPMQMTSQRAFELHDLANWRDVPDELAYFAARLCEFARRRAVPLYVSQANPRWVSIGHVVLGHSLTGDEWGLLRNWGFRVIASKSLKVRPNRADSPDLWTYTGQSWPATEGPPLRRTPRGILRTLAGW